MSFMPEVGHPFRLTSASIKELLCQDGNGVGHRRIPDTYEIRDGTWWTLRRSSKPVGGVYLIVPFESNRKLFYNCDRNDVGTFDGPQYDDQCWFIKFDPQDDSRFQLINYFGGNYRLYLRDHADPRVGGYTGPNYPDQYFRFNFGIPIVKSIEYQLDAAVYGGRRPRVVASRTFRNDTELEQQEKFTTKYTRTKSYQFEYTGGFKITVAYEVSFTAKIPFIGEGGSKFSLGAETSHQWKEGKTEEEKAELTYESPLAVPARSKVACDLIIYEERGDVPYQMTIGFKGSDATFKSEGKWVGVQCMQTDLKLEQSPI